MSDGLEIFWTPERILAAAVSVGLAVWLWVRWLAKLQPPPEPWGPEIDAALARPDVVTVCHRCFAPQPDLPGWFCPECGGAVGAYNNWMPYLYIFSIGEVLSIGTFRRFSVRPLTVVGLILFSFTQYHVFAPIYWYRLVRNIQRLRQAEAGVPPH